MKKLAVLNRLNMKTFEKNPQKGGTPAMENRAMIKNLVSTLFIPNEPKDDMVLVLKLTNWNKV